jgi:acyl carrier protein
VNNVKLRLREYILTNQLPGESPDTLRDSTPLQTSGILDSFAVLSLVDFVSREFAVELDVYDTGIDHFDSIEAIARTIARKQPGAQAMSA